MNSDLSKKRRRSPSSPSSYSRSSYSRDDRYYRSKQKRHFHRHSSRSHEKNYEKSHSRHHRKDRKREKSKKSEKHKHLEKEHSKHGYKSKRSSSSSHIDDNKDTSNNPYPINFPNMVFNPMQNRFPLTMNMNQINLNQSNLKMDNMLSATSFNNNYLGINNQNLIMGMNHHVNTLDTPIDKVVKDQNFLNSDDKLFETIVNSDINERTIFSKCQFSEKYLGTMLFKLIKKQLFYPSLDINEEEEKDVSEQNENIIDELGTALIDKKIENLNQKIQKIDFGDLSNITNNLIKLKQRNTNTTNDTNSTSVKA